MVKKHARGRHQDHIDDGPKSIKDLVEPLLPRVHAPTLLIVGGQDNPVLERNQRVFEKLGAREKKITVIDGATHLFEEPGAMEEVARLASAWLVGRLS